MNDKTNYGVCSWAAVMWLAFTVGVAWAAPPAAGVPRAGDRPRAEGEGDAADVVSSLVDELFTKAQAGSKGLRVMGPVRFDGVAWETGTGLPAGTSRLGLALDSAVRDAMVTRRVEMTALGKPDAKGIGGLVLRGAFQALKSSVKLSLSLVDAQSGRLLSEVRRVLQPAVLMQMGVRELLPPDSENTRLLSQLIRESLGGAPSEFAIGVTTDRGSNAAYFEGEQLHVTVQSDRDCYVRLYHISWRDKSLTLVFPNRSETDGYLPAGVLRRIPEQASKAVFEVSPPYGVDAIVAVASTEPFADDDWVASELGTQDSVTESASDETPADSERPLAEAPEQGTDAPSQPQVQPGGARAPTLPPPASAQVDSRTRSDIKRSGQFLTQSGLTASKARGVMAKGLLVRHVEDGSAPAADTEPPEQTGNSPSAASTVLTARAVCFFTTMPGHSAVR